MSTRRIRLDLTRSLASLVMLANLFLFCSSNAQARQVALAWDASTSPGVAGYQLSYGQISGSYAAQVDVGNQTSYTVTGLKDGATYYFAARAYNSGKTTWSEFSNEVSTTIPSGPVAAYNFAEVSGSKVIDASGQGNHGTRTGTSRITQGRFGKALSFDDLNDSVTVNDAASLDLTTGMTVEAWVYPTESMTGWRTLVAKESLPDQASYYLHANSDTDQPATGVFIGGYQEVPGGPWLLPNTWVHLAGTYDGATQRLYVNGTEVAKRAQSGPIDVSGGVLRIGGMWGEFFKGRIDEIRVYNRALSAAEITTDMNTSVATSSPPVFLVGDKNVAPVTDSNPQGKAQAFQTQAAVTGWVTGLSVYVDTGSTASKLVAGLYTDNNDHPGTLLAQGTLDSPGSGGWKMVSLPPVSTTAGSKYWVAILSPSGMLMFRDAGTWVGELSETSSESTLSKLPSTWTTGTYEFEGPLSAYGTGYP
jgi:Concanavalin A-like lectin/glucanases superfamily/Domain of unknown function (DUF4082)/Fibronectin type III domain